MKKYVSPVCIALFCSAALALTACGGSTTPAANSAADTSAAASVEASASAAQGSGTASGEVAEASTSSAQESAASAITEASTSAAVEAASSAAVADGSAKFTGDWKLAGLDYMGLAVTGNYSSLVGWTGGSMTIDSDGTGSVTLGEESGSFTWKQDGENKLAITMTGGAESIDAVTTLTLEDDVLTLEMSDEGTTGGMKFTRDGMIKGSPDTVLATASKITKEDALIGTWKLAGMTQNGAVIYGDADKLAEVSQLGDSTLVLEKGGKGTFGTQGAAWEVGANGATIKDDAGTEISVKAAGNYLVLNVGEPFDMDMTLFYTKA